VIRKEVYATVTAETPDVEAAIVAALAARDFPRAASMLLEGYGDEIFGFLVARFRDRAEADEVFSMFAEDLWRALPGVEIRTTTRAWAYAIARNAASRYLDRHVRTARRHVPLATTPELDALIVRVRTRTPRHLRTETKDAIARLRERLSDDERALLTLRVDRGLEWRELAEVLGEAGDDLPRAAARLRKRFEAVKNKLRLLAADEGLLDPGRDD
jgi:RNA polymerase sigma-70 factor (ECF subfamily)